MNQKVVNVPIEKLILDDRNPRLPNYYQGKSEVELIKYMLMEASTIDLMQAIGENGFFPGEMLLVVSDGSNKFRVIEGNRRATAVKLLRDPSLASVQKQRVRQVYDNAEHKPEDLPCLVFKTEQEIHKYLGYRHITGIEPWNLRQKARYLSSLKKELFPHKNIDEASQELRKMIGSTRDYVERLLIGYEIYKKIEDQGFFGIRDLDEASFYFGYIADSLRWSNIIKFLGVKMDADDPLEEIVVAHLKKWTQWLFEKYGEGGKTKLKGKSGDLKKLNAIVATPRALKAFDEDGESLNTAYELTDDIGEIFRKSLENAIVQLETADSMSHRVDKFYLTLDEDLRQIARLIKKINQAKLERKNDLEDLL